MRKREDFCNRTAGYISSAVRPGQDEFLTGQVEAVFQNSLNLTMKGRLLHIGGCSRPLCAFGISVSDEMVARLRERCAPGNLVRLKNGSLTLYGTEVCTIDLTALNEVDLRLTGPGISEKAAGRLYELIPEELELGICRDEEFTRRTERLVQTSEGMEWLIGRGLGLTPSGDDILMGYGLSRWALGRKQEFDRALDRCDLSRTTPVSRAYLSHLRQNTVNQNIKELFSLLESGDEAAVREHLEGIRNLGHTSGSDLLFGLKIGLKAQ